MAVLGTRVELDVLPQEVISAMSHLRIMFRHHTTYDGVQITFGDLREGMGLPTVDVQVSDTPGDE